MKTGFYMTLLLAICSCHQRIDRAAEGERLMQTSREWAKAAAARDVDKTVGYWADDAVLISAGQPTLKGKAAIRRMVEESFRTPGFRISWQPQSAVVSENGDLAYLLENSQIAFTDSSGKLHETQNKAVTIWRKQPDGSWKDVVDMSTPDSL